MVSYQHSLDVYLMTANPSVSQQLISAAADGQTSKVRGLLSLPLQFSDYNLFCALYQAAHGGHVECLETLLAGAGFSPPHPYFYQTFNAAVAGGHLACVARLAPLCSTSQRFAGLSVAAQHGQTSVLEFMIGAGFAAVCDNHIALVVAAKHGNADCVRLLLNVLDARANNSQALCMAALEEHVECVDLLYPHSCPLTALKQLKIHYPDSAFAHSLLEHAIDRHQRKVLVEATNTCGRDAPGRKI